MMTAASLERAGVACHHRAKGRRSATAKIREIAARNRSVKKVVVSAEDIASSPPIFNAGNVETRHLIIPMLARSSDSRVPFIATMLPEAAVSEAAPGKTVDNLDAHEIPGVAPAG
ncbi:hypothetical protein MAE02_50170 [Microvirga aerophila]|uniref:Uncharacterized protein n=1 Tax=Microvirga aerophila TaxID=670291 RepID=A0A512BZD9_9HYPH|nr:hypothetical protein MAE02_50170 [Microvirga aerophila]